MKIDRRSPLIHTPIFVMEIIEFVNMNYMYMKLTVYIINFSRQM